MGRKKSAQKRKSPEEKIIGLSRSKRNISGRHPQSIVSKRLIRRMKLAKSQGTLQGGGNQLSLSFVAIPAIVYMVCSHQAV